MTISKEEIKADFERFIRHEAMRANCTQSEIREIIEFKQAGPVSEDLEEAATLYAKEEYRRNNPATLPDRCIGCYEPIMYAFRNGANWQKQQMMKDAVDCFVGPREGWFYIGPLIPQHYHNLEKDEEIKMVIIKE